VNLAKSNVSFWTAPPRAETVFLPNKLFQSAAAVDPVSSEGERAVHELCLGNQLRVHPGTGPFAQKVGAIPVES